MSPRPRPVRRRAGAAGLRALSSFFALGVLCAPCVTAVAQGVRPPQPAASQAAVVAPSVRALAPFAQVGDTVVSGADYQRALAVAMRKKYYHAKPPEAEYARFQREVGQDVVDRVLLLAEARKRGVQPDRERIKATVAGYDQQYKGSANWAANRDKMLAAVVPQLEQDSLLERLEKIVRAGPEPGDEQLRAFYEQNKALFLEPEQVKLRVIVLRVDPSSPQAAWNGAKAEAQQIHKRLLAGADFGDLARLHSNDRSAPQGGEMDYTHRGMLPEAVHAVVDKLAVGALAEPAQLLEGWVLIKLEGRKPAQQRSLEQARGRAAELWLRAEGEQRWTRLKTELRAATPVRIDESHYAPLRGPTEKPRAG